VHPGSGGAPPIVQSEIYERLRHARAFVRNSSDTDCIMLSNKPQPPAREREYQWSQRNMDAPIQHSPSMHDYRDRDMDVRKHYSHRPSSQPGPVDDRNDRPTSSPFIVAPASISTVPPSSATPIHPSRANRMPPAGYLGGLSSHEAHRSSIQAHRYTPGAPPGRPASSIHHMVSPPPPINRACPPPSPYPHSASRHQSSPTRYVPLSFRLKDH
jgi:hypothetical protein